MHAGHLILSKPPTARKETCMANWPEKKVNTFFAVMRLVSTSEVKTTPC